METIRICRICETQMKDGLYVKVEGGNYGIRITKTKGVFAQKIGDTRAAV